MALARGGPCLPLGANCSQRFVYEWDEVGRLARARRWDLSSAGTATDPVPNAIPDAELRYAYDGADMRVLKTAVDGAGTERHTVYVFGSLELRRAPFASIDGRPRDYEASAWTVVPYLFAHGVRLGRVVYGHEDLPALASGRQHVFLELQDHLGSSSIALDKATSELVERSTYQAYGGAESDYRPERWRGFREDYRFTGKEEDVEVGLQYFGKRYLAPLLGRWISADPLAIHSLCQADESGGDQASDAACELFDEPNAYAYVKGAVLAAVDEEGLQSRPPRLPTPGRPVVPRIAPPPPEPPRISARRWTELGVRGMPPVVRRVTDLPLIRTEVVPGRYSPPGGYVIAPHGRQIRPRIIRTSQGTVEVESHHGMLTEMVRRSIYQYDQNMAPTILLTKEQHQLTVRIWNSARSTLMRNGTLPSREAASGRREIDWENVPEHIKRVLSDALMEHVKVPKAARDAYWRQYDCVPREPARSSGVRSVSSEQDSMGTEWKGNQGHAERDAMTKKRYADELVGPSWDRVRALRFADRGDEPRVLDGDRIPERLRPLLPYASALSTGEEGLWQAFVDALEPSDLKEVLAAVDPLYPELEEYTLSDVPGDDEYFAMLDLFNWYRYATS